MEVLGALRSYAVRYQEFAHQMAAFIHLPMNDGAALGEILWAESEASPLSAARLRWRIGMTSGATNTLIGRLEAAGLVTRTRESEDRRVVTLRATTEARLRTDPFLQPSAANIHAALDAYSEHELRTHTAFVHHLTSALTVDSSAVTTRSA
jgi:MarR family transcriptional regulator, organic hydroperoxide resistance regulator